MGHTDGCRLCRVRLVLLIPWVVLLLVPPLLLLLLACRMGLLLCLPLRRTLLPTAHGVAVREGIDTHRSRDV